ncbi:MAG: porin [Geobacteraceae bacterium]|nr:porin [Geobacteraceae bacterium]
MKKKIVLAFGLIAATLTTGTPCSAAFVVGSENGWQFSTDGIVDVFSTYQTSTKLPTGNRFASFLNGNTESTYENFDVRVGLLPSVIAFNIKAPTTNGVDSSVRVGIYPSIQNSGGQNNRFDVNPNTDFREFFYTAKGKSGELLAGRALNLYQGKNILTDMTLLTAGVVPAPGTSTTLGHIGYGYLYTNFGPQIRYTTPDFGGVKVAVSIAEPYKIDQYTAKTNTPRLETEVSYARTSGDTSLQAWASGLYQGAKRSNTAAARPGGDNHSIGSAAGVQAGFGKVDLLASGYYGEGLGMISVQDGANQGAWGSSAVDESGKERTQFGFLAQATYKLTPEVKVGLNYGQSSQTKTSFDKASGGSVIPMEKQEATSAIVVYNFNKFTQFVVEYSFAQNTWQDKATQRSHSAAIGTMFYW